jgi:uncharacterized protein (TIGR01777 family)
MKILIAGASGHLGALLDCWFESRGDDVEGMSRGAGVIWDGRTVGEWKSHLEGIDLLINLAGRSVNCRYNEANRRQILESRVDSTRALAEAISQCQNPPRVWLNSSTATIYRHAEDRPQDEATGELGSGFSVEVAKAWEAALFESDLPRVRRVALRSAMVMATGPGGPFDVFYRLAKAGVGRMGSGRQRVSWVHGEDFCRAVQFLAFESEMDGAVNISAPETPTNEELLRALREASGRKLALPLPVWALEVGAFVMRTETELPLKSRWVRPGRLLEAGFEFAFPSWPPAARDLVQRSA